MNKKRIIVIFVILFLFIICYQVINTKYDRLARYPYGNETEREIIKNKLTDKEIEYIVEYSILPDYFFKYVNCYHFNIYHVESYNRFRNLFPNFDVHDTVTIVERLSLLNKDNDNFYNSLLSVSLDYAENTLKSYLW